jgi:hypothetical protein
MTQPLLIEAELALLDSIKRGDTEAVGWLLAAGTDPNAFDFLEGNVALRIATARGHLTIARLLLEHGARPVEPPRNGSPPAEAPRPNAPAERKPAASPTSQRKSAGQPPGERMWPSELARLYWESGYICRPVGAAKDDSVGRNEDWQVRFILRGKGELNEAKRVLEKAGFTFAPPERRFGNQRVTIVGREAVQRLTALLADLRQTQLNRGGPP